MNVRHEDAAGEKEKKITFDRNAKGVREMLSMKFDTLDFKDAWYDAFGTPERRGYGLSGEIPVTAKPRL